MATKEQYEFYKLLYDEENAREKQLREQARNYLSLATLYSAFVIFGADKALPSISWPAKCAFIASIVFMAAAFVLSLWVLQASKYEAIASPSDVTNQFGEASMTNEEFFDNRIADLTVACERNISVDDRKAVYLGLSGYAVLIGIFLHAGFFILRSI
jgi:hypothetical protein